MLSDLDYFHESTLYNSNVYHFSKNLPIHLRKKFENSLHVDILWGNILHGYRGPSNFCDGSSDDSGILPPSHGLTEIKFWWGMRKWISGVTLGLAIGVQKAISHLEWSSLYFDSKTGECLSHDKNEAVERLNGKGNQLFMQGNYSDAVEYYSNAYQASSHKGKWHFYAASRKIAQTELDAMNLSSLADDLFEQGKYVDAASRYQEAYDKSHVKEKKNMYNGKKKQIQCIINKLSILDDLWKKAWDAENDAQNDRGEEAKEILKTMLRVAENNLQTFPGSSKLKEYKNLATMKIKGNEMFNRGLVLQQKGIILFQEAQKLKQQEKYETAKITFEDAKYYFHEAREQYQMGGESDQRFVSCVEIVQERINVVMQSIEMTEQRMLSARLSDIDVNITDNNHLDINPLNLDRIEQHNTYYQQI